LLFTALLIFFLSRCFWFYTHQFATAHQLKMR
jgi:hypothetical protein